MKENIKIILVTTLSLVLDQIIKYIITTNLKLTEMIQVIKNFFRITYVQNTGAAFSIFTDSKTFLIILSVLILLILVYYITKTKHYKYDFILYGMLIGGILGNLIDRMRLGYVIDYLDFNLGGYNFPVFNLADTFIVISGIILMIRIMMEDKK